MLAARRHVALGKEIEERLDLDNFIDYLSADNALLQAENSLALSEISSATSLIAIYKALGGGWEIVSEEELDKKFEAMKLAEAAND